MTLRLLTGLALATGLSACALPSGQTWVEYARGKVQVDSRLFDIDKFLLVNEGEKSEDLIPQLDTIDISRLRWVARVDADKVTCREATDAGCVYSIRMTLRERGRGMY